MTQATKAEYFPISPLILRPDFKVPFDIFLRHDDSHVLFNASGRTMTKAKRKELALAGIVTIYVDKRSRRLYHDYIRANLLDLLEDESISLTERAQAWTNAATALSKELFETNLPGPAFKKRYVRFQELIRSSAGFLSSPEPLRNLTRFIGKGYETYHHGISTMIYAVNLMQEYKFGDDEVLACGMGALLHDIGLVGMDKALLETDPAAMSPASRQIFTMHPLIGVRVCAHFDLPIIATNCILFHHERIDGKGYPTQASGEEIPLPTRVVALCNRYDDLTRNRPYSRAVKPFDALKSLTDDKGLVEPDMLKRFIKLLSRAEIV
ncbi:metal dependent phosphohydrolase [Pseudodesulfovibrio mercurii]|uniref:Metal dependent phosphohydrolase n=1 Tax=Pseudodesulfovibrio mercurii TaxID=641491 RepID=F0JBV0_9BACT|nr:HD domain-containing phosphohydrolase [Pseudodesulfovibrio mercurii]EGB14343.1 metal dependent phosphohydrolase [Pseudodesulfovibrio mercurii]